MLPGPSPAIQTRSQLLATDFKKLVNSHYATERSLAFYADKLCIISKHLAETVKETTGKRAATWLAEAVLLEASVLLQNPVLTIAQIAEPSILPTHQRLVGFSERVLGFRRLPIGSGVTRTFSPRASRPECVAD